MYHSVVIALCVVLCVVLVVVSPVEACTPWTVGTPGDKCEFYKCLEDKYNCESEKSSGNNYPLGYGYKYCMKFAALTEPPYSAAVIAWRESTLQCLQQALEDFTTRSDTCEHLTTAAFASHPNCYTQHEHSICALSVNTQRKIAAVVDWKDLATRRSIKQAAAVAKICAGASWKSFTTSVSNKVSAITRRMTNLKNRVKGALGLGNSNTNSDTNSDTDSDTSE